MMNRLILLVVGLLGGLGQSGCANLRVYTTFEYKHVRSEVQTKPTGERGFLAGIFRDGQGWSVRIMETLMCEQQKIEVAEETAKIKITAPTWPYYVGLGAITAAVSTPFWVLGSLTSQKSEAAKHYLVGTLMFLIPGLAIVGAGVYYRMRAGTFYKKMGQRRRVKSKIDVPCKVVPAVGRQVRLGTRTGQNVLGRTDAKGRIRLDITGLRPLVRWSGDRVTKAYFDVQVENEPGQEVRLPKDFPVQAADLKAPRPRR
jgi:hypothetical protein